MAKKRTKRQYRLRNWSQCNKALAERGSPAVWVSEDVLSTWHNHTRTGRRGETAFCADTAILCVATLAEAYRLPLRAAAGLTRALVRLLGVELSVPGYTTLCRRRRSFRSRVAAPPEGLAAARGG